MFLRLHTNFDVYTEEVLTFNLATGRFERWKKLADDFQGYHLGEHLFLSLHSKTKSGRCIFSLRGVTEISKQKTDCWNMGEHGTVGEVHDQCEATTGQEMSWIIVWPLSCVNQGKLY